MKEFLRKYDSCWSFLLCRSFELGLFFLSGAGEDVERVRRSEEDRVDLRASRGDASIENEPERALVMVGVMLPVLMPEGLRRGCDGV